MTKAPDRRIAKKFPGNPPADEVKKWFGAPDATERAEQAARDSKEKRRERSTQWLP